MLSYLGVAAFASVLFYFFLLHVTLIYMSQYNNCPSTPEVANLLMVEPGSEREFMSVMQPVCLVKHCDFDLL